MQIVNISLQIYSMSVKKRQSETSNQFIKSLCDETDVQ
jgi:hypothetical protein